MYRSDNASYAFNLIVRKYQQRLYHHIRRMVKDHDDTHDIMQNTFIKAWNALGDFREEANLFTWLYRIATNESITFLNKQKRTQGKSIDTVKINAATHKEGDASTVTSEEIREKLQKAINLLPEKQRIVFNMKYYEEMKYEEMSEILDTSVGALKASYHHAIKKIEEYLTGN